MPSISVVLVDDHPVVCEGFRRLLENSRDIRVVGEAYKGSEGYQRFITESPDVTVVDLSLPDMGGLELIRRIRMRNPAAKILVFSVFENEILVERALAAGAQGYISKRSAPKHLIQAIRTVASGREFVDVSVLRTDTGVAGNNGGLLGKLTPREFEVFRHLAEGHSVTEIAELLNASAKTIGVHQTRIMKKLNVSNAVQLSRIAINAEIVLP